MPAPQIFDILALILVGWLTLRGMMRGIVAQIMSIVSVVASWVIAVKLSPVVAPMVSDEPPWNRLIAMLILFVAGFIAFWLIRGLLDGILKTIRLKSADRSLGGILGFLKGIMLCLIITFFLVIFSDNTRNFALESNSGKYFVRGIEKISILIPEDASEILSKMIAKFQGLLEEEEDTNPKPLDNFHSLLSDTVKEKINQAVKDNFSGVLSLKDLETQSPPSPAVPSLSPLQEKVTSSPMLAESPEPAKTSPRPVVLPFQPNK